MRRLFYLIAAASIVANLVFGRFVITHYPTLRPTIKKAYRELRFKPSRDETRCLEEIVSHVDSMAFQSATAKIDYVRHFVNENSVHSSGEDRPWNTPYVIKRLYQTFRGGGAEPAQLTCGPRALAMQALLREMGITSRFVQLFADDADHIRSHSVLDVFNPDSGDWEMQDPDNDICLIDVNSGKRAATMDALLLPLNRIHPMSYEGTRGWAELDLDHLRPFYSGGLYGNLEFLQKPGVVKKAFFVNTSRFDCEKKYPANGGETIYDFMRRRHGDPVFIYYEGAPRGDG